MEELFYELLQVATGQLDCLSRGPEPEEWQELYQMAKRQKVVGIAYHGVEKLFEFGLRAPQDISIDWMAEAELTREYNERIKKRPALARNYPDTLKMLRQIDGDELNGVSSPAMELMYKLYLQRKLNMRTLMDYYYWLCENAATEEPIKGNGVLGLSRFAQGLMWVLDATMGLKEEQMLCPEQEKEGRFLLNDIMQKATRREHVLHALISYPLGIMDLRA